MTKQKWLRNIMTRLEVLNHCLQIARDHKNPYMEYNIQKEIQHETNNPSDETYPDPTDDKE